jgi:hypothetical protein
MEHEMFVCNGLRVTWRFTVEPPDTEVGIDYPHAGELELVRVADMPASNSMNRWVRAAIDKRRGEWARIDAECDRVAREAYDGEAHS